MKKIVCLIALVLLLSGCEVLKEIYGIEDAPYVPIEEIQVVQEISPPPESPKEVAPPCNETTKEVNYSYSCWQKEKVITLGLGNVPIAEYTHIKVCEGGKPVTIGVDTSYSSGAMDKLKEEFRKECLGEPR